MRTWSPALGLALAVAACAPTPKPRPPVAAPAPPSPPTAVPAPAPVADWRDLPLTPGTWSYAAAPGGSVARFGVTPASAVFEMRCDLARREVTLTLLGQGGGSLELRTSYATHPIPLRAAMAEVRAAFAARDRTLDEIAFSRGRFTLAVPGAPALVLPAWAEPARVIEDCRE